jgi:mannose-1-phosphate guanylyltransferase
MIADTLARLMPLADPSAAWILTARDLAAAVRAAVPDVPARQVIGEPMGRNTAPAIALAAWWLRGAGSNAVAAVLPSDHRIEPADAFRKDLEEAAGIALERRAIVVLGIPPTHPETGYGSIEQGAGDGSGARRVAAFRRSPTGTRRPGTSRRGVSGTRGCSSSRRRSCSRRSAPAPQIRPRSRGCPIQRADLGERPRVLRRPSISIDYAVMERTRNALVLPARFGWDDLGSWAASPAPTGTGGEHGARSGPPRGRGRERDLAGRARRRPRGAESRDRSHRDVTLVCL